MARPSENVADKVRLMTCRCQPLLPGERHNVTQNRHSGADNTLGQQAKSKSH